MVLHKVINRVLNHVIIIVYDIIKEKYNLVLKKTCKISDSEYEECDLYTKNR